MEILIFLILILWIISLYATKARYAKALENKLGPINDPQWRARFVRTQLHIDYLQDILNLLESGSEVDTRYKQYVRTINSLGLKDLRRLQTDEMPGDMAARHADLQAKVEHASRMRSNQPVAHVKIQ